jgi:hypothetical protein
LAAAKMGQDVISLGRSARRVPGVTMELAEPRVPWHGCGLAHFFSNRCASRNGAPPDLVSLRLCKHQFG